MLGRSGAGWPIALPCNPQLCQRIITVASIVADAGWIQFYRRRRETALAFRATVGALLSFA